MKAPSILPTALLISDNASKVSFFKKTFKDLYYILDVEDCSTALTWLKTTKVQLILLDLPSLEEPLMNFCMHISKITQKNNPPIFLICKIIKKQFIEDSLKAGVTDFIHEPLDSNEVYERIAVHFNSSVLEKKIKTITKNIQSPPLVAQNTQKFSGRTVIRDKSLKQIIETKKIATPLSVLPIQLDSFVKLSKILGEKGIKEISHQIELFLQAHLRQQDFLVTEGPGHYLVFLPKTSTTAAKIIAEDIRKEVARTTLLIDSSEILVTVSIGIISFEKELSGSAKAFEQFESCLEKIKSSLVNLPKKGSIVVSPEHEA
jgi:diguanylate cyclase (GGDEF)-like protein